MAKPYNMVSHDAQQALTEFSLAFDGALALGGVEAWATRFGLANSSRAIRTTYPIPLTAAGYVERSGDDKLRRLFEKSLSMSPIEWVDGVQEKAQIIEAPDFIGWAKEPQAIALEAQRQPNVLVASMLHDNPLLDLYRTERPGGSVASTIRLFANNHPVNIVDSDFGTFDNLHAAAALNEAAVIACKLRFRTRKGPNGKPMGLRWTHVLVPSALEEQALDFFASDTLIRAVENALGTENVGGVTQNNRHKGTVEVVVCDELEDDNIVYPVCLGRAFPWVIQDGGAPEEIRYDKTSDHYKNTGMVAVKYVLQMAAAAALPHAIESITIG